MGLQAVTAQVTFTNVTINGTLAEGNTVYGFYNCDTDTLTDPVFTYAWKSYDTSGADEQDISGETNPSLLIQSALVGRKIKFFVTATNTYGTASETGESPLSNEITGNNPPTVTNVTIIVGSNLMVGSTLYGDYDYHDAENNAEGDSEFKWEKSPNGVDTWSTISSATSISYVLKSNDAGNYIRFSVKPVAATGNPTDDTFYASNSTSGPVTDNLVAVAANVGINVLSNLNVGSTLLGTYDYSDPENDPEGDSGYRWFRGNTPATATSEISGETGITYVLQMADTGKYIKFEVTPVASTGNTSDGTAEVSSLASGPVNDPPYIENLSIESTISSGGTITASYDFHDPDAGDNDACEFRWFRDGVEFINPNSTYDVTDTDQGADIYVMVTAVSDNGYPDRGNTLTSNTCSVSLSTLPLATGVCIRGNRTQDYELEGKYTYDDNGLGGSEGNSVAQWLVNDVVVKEVTLKSYQTDWSSKKYKLNGDTINMKIVFRVVPKKNSSVIGDTTASAPLASITNTKTSFSMAEDPVLLTAIPEVDVFSGGGVYLDAGSYYFDPGDTTDFDINNPVTIEHRLETSVGGCVQKDYIDFDVNAATTYFVPSKEVYCYSTVSDNISIGGLPAEYMGNGVFSIIPAVPGGLVQTSDQAATIYPQVLGATPAGKEVTMVYTYSTMSTLGLILNYKISKGIVIDSVGQDLKITNITDQYCEEEDPVTITISNEYPKGGTGQWGYLTDNIFTEQSDFNAVIDPSLKAGGGTETIDYTYTSPLGCQRVIQVPITVNPTPELGFSIADGCIESSTDTTKFINSSVDPGQIESWLWEFGEAMTTVSTDFEPGFMYRTEGKRNVTLIGTTFMGCRDTLVKEIGLGVKPEGDFYWEDDCFYLNEDLKLFDATKPTSTIDSLFWVFNHTGGKDTLFNVLNPTFTKQMAEVINVEYYLLTKYPGCQDTVVKDINIRPVYVIKDEPYAEDFQGGEDGWIKDVSPGNKWKTGFPEYVVGNDTPGNVAWFTDTLQVGETDFAVESPCFDFRDVERPMIRMNIFRNFDEGRDGAVLQYKVGNNATWTNIGGTDFGIQWYKNSNIAGSPGGSVVGWSVKDDSWVEAKQYLDDLIGLYDVKLRVAYGSDRSAQNRRGFAFDNIWIGERSRNVLIEHFTNYNFDQVSADNIVKGIIDNAPLDAVNIQYHNNYRSGDQLYLDNTAVPNARMLFYSLVRNPYTLFDGGTSVDNAYGYSFVPPLVPNLADLRNRSMIDPLFKLRIDTLPSHTFKVVMEPLKDMDVENLTLYIAIVAKEITTLSGSNGQTVFRNVLREMLPDAAGTDMKKVWTAGEGETEVGTFSRSVPWIYDSENIEVIAFLQNNNTREIYQAATTGPFKANVTAVGKLEYDEPGFSLYPNPAFGRVTFVLDDESTGDTKMIFMNNAGVVVREQVIPAGLNRGVIDDLGLPAGIYIVRVVVDGKPAGYRKLVVAGR